MSFWESCRVRRNFQRIRNTSFFKFAFSSIDVVLHRHEDDSIFELFTLNPVLFHNLLDLTKQLQCCVSWEFFHSSRLVLRQLNAIHDNSGDFMNHSIFQASIDRGYS